MSLIAKTEELHHIRTSVDYAKERVAAIERDIEARYGEELRREKDVLAKKIEALNAIDAEVRRLAIEEFQSTGDKAPAPGVTVALRPKLVYDEGEAIMWAWLNAPTAITLKRKEMNDALTPLAESGTLPGFAQFERTPEVRIASDLVAAMSPKPRRLTAEDLAPEAMR